MKKEYTWKKGKREVVGVITCLNEHQFVHDLMEMWREMSFAGYELIKTKFVK